MKKLMYYLKQGTAVLLATALAVTLLPMSDARAAGENPEKTAVEEKAALAEQDVSGVQTGTVSGEIQQMTLGESYAVIIASGETKTYSFTPEESGSYTFGWGGADCPEGKLLDSYRNELASTCYVHSTIIYKLEKGQTYYLEMSTMEMYGAVRDCSVKVKKVPEIPLGENSITVAEDEIAVYSFTPEDTETYTFASATNKSCATLLGNDGKELVSDGGGMMGFSITYKLEKGQTYYLKINHEWYDEMVCAVSIKKTPEMRLGESYAVTLAAGEMANYSFIPEERGRYIFELKQEKNGDFEISCEYGSEQHESSTGNNAFVIVNCYGPAKIFELYAVSGGNCLVSVKKIPEIHLGESYNITLEEGEMEVYSFTPDEYKSCTFATAEIFSFDIELWNSSFESLGGIKSTSFITKEWSKGCQYYVVMEAKEKIRDCTVSMVTTPVYHYGTLGNGTVSFLKYNGSDVEFVIPAEIDGKKVTNIGKDAFYECDLLSSVTIPSGVTEIGDSAFAGCRSLSSVTIPSGVTKIGNSTFEMCRSLSSVTIPSGVTEIGDSAFLWCSGLTSVTLPASVKKIRDYAFLFCDQLADVYFAGTQAQWNSIEIRERNETLTNATIHYGNECSHSHTTMINKKAATCTAQGYTGDTKCSDCGEIIKKGTVIKAKGHTIVTDKAVSATCTRSGKTAGSHCSVCNKVIVAQKTIAAKGHTVVTDKAVSATCTRSGKTAGSHCSVCKKVIVAQKTIAAKGHTYKTTTNAATLTKTGSIVTKCSVCGAKKTTKTIYRPKTIKLSKTTFTYNGRNQKPSVTVKDSKGKAISSKYYTVSYKNCKNAGEATATVTFKGNYKGTKKLTYKIVPKNTSSLQAGAKSKGFTVKWKKQSSQTTGYQIQYSTSSKFKGAKTQTIKSSRTTTYTAKKLKAKQKYYVRIRTYKRAKVSGKYQNVYSAWSKTKTVKTKK